ncbi:hypothetical protein BGX21_002991 [Mortierella sp. AD011]|nr:hypothetical protein BGX20_005186 [Mortierella sp. AD010]KAF9401000.1 hypothetical protein BGX21_002991 [Mortierella sp. AD011]
MAPPPINILCLGDSLTNGHIRGRAHTPYSDHIQSLLNSNGQNHVTLFNAGVDGDTVPGMLSRLPTLLQQAQFHHVIFLGGTNDLAFVSNADDITPEQATAHISFKPIYDILVAQQSIKSFLHLTVPYNTFDRLDPDYKSYKDALNNRIISGPCPKKSFLDLNNPALNFNHLLMTEDERDELWSDALHYSNLGYKRLATCIYTELEKMLVS